MLGSAGRAPGTDGSCGFPIRFEYRLPFLDPLESDWDPVPKAALIAWTIFYGLFLIRRRVAPEYCS